MTNLRLSLPEGDEVRDTFPMWFVRAQCVRAGFPKMRGKPLSPREEAVDVDTLELAIAHAYFLGETLGALCPDLAARVLAADPFAWVPLDASDGRDRLSDAEVVQMYAAPMNFATELRQTRPDWEWIPWWWLGNEGTQVPYAFRGRMRVLLRRQFAMHVLYRLNHRDEFWARVEAYREGYDERHVGLFTSWDAEALAAWAEDAVEAFERLHGRLPALLGQD